ncbi:MAG: IS91 family transposase [Gloeobacteraceae cyanobacterium ES-bin-316]|nr:IS91 family transposase [Ferruginibacter sp.]
MEQQPLNDIRQLLQRKIFGHKCTEDFNPYSRAIFHRLQICHTAGIGVHHLKCNKASCSNEQYQYHSCGNRHCPNCGGLKKEQWLQDRMSELLPTTYYHLVFTLPQELRSLVMGNRTVLFNLLFDASHHTITKLSADKKWLGAKPGIVSILHTNGQDLSFHPHIHCIVSGGGINAAGNWIKEKRGNGNYLYPKPAMEKEYKLYFLKKLQALLYQQKLKTADTTALKMTLYNCSKIRWNVHANAPFGGPAQILEYLGRYTHKTAITSHRIKEITHTTITFTYKDYADGKKQKQMTLTHEEFARRFEQHILPKGFVKIRHGGYLAHNGKNKRIAAIHQQLKLPAPMPKVVIPFSLQMLQRTGQDYSQCPTCKEGKMERIASYLTRNGRLVNIKDLTRSKTKNKASPPINQTASSKGL